MSRFEMFAKRMGQFMFHTCLDHYFSLLFCSSSEFLLLIMVCVLIIALIIVQVAAAIYTTSFSAEYVRYTVSYIIMSVAVYIITMLAMSL